MVNIQDREAHALFIGTDWEGDPRTGWCEKCYPPHDSDCFHGKCNHRYHKAED